MKFGLSHWLGKCKRLFKIYLFSKENKYYSIYHITDIQKSCNGYPPIIISYLLSAFVLKGERLVRDFGIGSLLAYGNLDSFKEFFYFSIETVSMLYGFFGDLSSSIKEPILKR